MIKLFVTFLLALAVSFSVAQNKQPIGVTYSTQIIKVTDGDTIVIAAPYLPMPLKPQLAVRIFGVDTPESGFRAKCDIERQKGQAATEFAKNAVIQSKQHQVVLYNWDKFGGRVLGDIILDGRSLRRMLITNGHAKEYYGDAKQSWCN
jgi:endonuclease YncB( thermonuclease family)